MKLLLFVPTISFVSGGFAKEVNTNADYNESRNVHVRIGVLLYSKPCRIVATGCFEAEQVVVVASTLQFLSLQHFSEVYVCFRDSIAPAVIVGKRQSNSSPFR
eukprot:gb/GECG01012139.1/.p1 GENE.gb/GECG01012139.1/~~gb/GECG01012139.1/.p1  ORF type:complete len:103 (+),score=7.30 gb/GECG01012139.1/:1-309(+)